MAGKMPASQFGLQRQISRMQARAKRGIIQASFDFSWTVLPFPPRRRPQAQAPQRPAPKHWPVPANHVVLQAEQLFGQRLVPAHRRPPRDGRSGADQYRQDASRAGTNDRLRVGDDRLSAAPSGAGELRPARRPARSLQGRTDHRRGTDRPAGCQLSVLYRRINAACRCGPA